ncbi:MAG: PQQ-dependent sugar dehydrogenase [Acidimicrobiia bacterium]
MKHRSLWLFVLLLALVGLPAAQAQTTLPPGGTFLDDDGNPHEGAIEAIAAADITTGCSPELFCPSAPVTRAEMAAFLVRALNQSPLAASGTFSDVGAGQWYTGFVERIAQLGISTGYADGTFRPLHPTSRGEMALFLMRALDLTPIPHASTFSDVEPGAFFTEAVEAIAADGITNGCGGGRYCPFDQVLRDQMATFLTRGWDLTPNVPPPRTNTLALATIATGFDSPLFLASPPGDDRLFVVEQTGRILIVGGETFLDLSGAVSSGGERGLLGLAFHPDYASNGRFFVNYTNASGDTRVVEYEASPDPNRADTGSARQLLAIDQPASNHNGGWLGFGPDGLLYIAMGDGGGANDQFGNAQDPSSLLGKILRMNPDQPGAEIWVTGARNPWRNSFDGDLLFVADVGQNAREEVNVISRLATGVNLGWPLMEGSNCLSGPCGGFVGPVAEYTHSQGCSITGGYVYRGTALAGLAGTYFYSDFCEGTLRSFRYTGTGITDSKIWGEVGDMGSVTSFGVDSAGEIYVVTQDGRIRKITPG